MLISKNVSSVEYDLLNQRIHRIMKVIYLLAFWFDNETWKLLFPHASFIYQSEWEKEEILVDNFFQDRAITHGMDMKSIKTYSLTRYRLYNMQLMIRITTDNEIQCQKYFRLFRYRGYTLLSNICVEVPQCWISFLSVWSQELSYTTVL